MELKQNQNMLNWYPFKSNASVLQIGENNEVLTEILSKKVETLITAGNKLDDIKSNEKFDYITLIGSLPYVAKENNIKSSEVIKRASEFLKPDGKLLIAVDNKFGIRYFVGNPEPFLNKKFVSLLNYNNEEEKIETYTRQKLISILDENGFKGKNFYYPLPDFRVPNVIFSDLELPNYTNIAKYRPYHTEKSDILVDEIDLFREILKTDESLFTFFANAYFIEASKEKNEHSYKYISYNNIRKCDYQLITKIGENYVEKDIVTEKAISHYEQIKENIELLKSRNINTVDEIYNGKIRSKYINQECMLATVLTKLLEEEKQEEFYNILDKYYEILKKSSDKMNEEEINVFDKYSIEISLELKQNLNFIQNGLWDMTLKNCFYIDDDFYFFDQEWKEKNLPVEYILYRAIMYTISLRRFINVNEILKRYDLEKYTEVFLALDNKLQEEIRDEDTWNFYSKNCYFDIDSTKQEMINMGIRSEAKDKEIERLRNEDLSSYLKRRWARRKENE